MNFHQFFRPIKDKYFLRCFLYNRNFSRKAFAYGRIRADVACLLLLTTRTTTLLVGNNNKAADKQRY